MKCKLCKKEDRSLLKKSHIIPNFMYRELFDDKHRFINATLNDLNNIKYFQSGIYEKKILCKKCDNEIFGNLEKYASGVLYNSNSNFKISIEKHKSYDGLDFLHIKNINYQKFKLFLLSILWRASISKDIFFKEVELGPYEETVRKLLINQNIFQEDVFRITMILFNNNINEEIDKFISPPRKFKKDLKTIYFFYICKLFYFFEISKNSGLEIFDKGNLSMNNTINIPIIYNVTFKSFLKKFYDLDLK
jgi:hypothetical protein